MSGTNLGPEADRYESVEDGSETETTLKGSRFLGQAFRAEDEAAAADRLDGIRRRHHAATHHCWAYRLGDPESSRERWNDDGEPSGTAGVPILGALRHEDLYQVLLVVTRYYGGTKLGTGGLVRAYGDSAREALLEAPRRTVWRVSTLRVECAFDHLGPVEATLNRWSDCIHEIRREFSPEPIFLITVLRSRAEALASILVESTSGKARIQEEGGGD